MLVHNKMFGKRDFVIGLLAITTFLLNPHNVAAQSDTVAPMAPGSQQVFYKRMSDSEFRYSSVKEILNMKCMSCHRPAGSASDFSQFLADERLWVSANLIVPKQPQNSLLFKYLQGSGFSPSPLGSMPQGGILSASELSVFRQWIEKMNEGSALPNPGFTSKFNCTQPATSIIASSIQRLSKEQLVNSLRDFLSRFSTSEQNTLLNSVKSQLDIIPDDSDSVFTRRDNRVFQEHVDAFFEIAWKLANTIVSSTSYSNTWIRGGACGSSATKASLATAACLDSVIDYYGRKTYRRPITSAERADFKNFYNSISAADDKIIGLIARFIFHPKLFYRFENEGSQLSGTQGIDAEYQLTKYELLSKMTFLYWAAPPDDALYTLVSNLDLNKDEAMNQLLGGIASNSKMKTGIRNFYSEWLRLKDIAHFDMPSVAFLTLAAGENINLSGHDHRSQMIDEILDFTEYYTLTTPGRYEDLMNSNYSFAKGSDLAKLYGINTWNGSGIPPQFSSPLRSGLLTRAAFLVSANEYTRPIIKGKKIRTQLLCDVVNPPPPSLMIVPLVQQIALSTTDVVTKATQSQQCSTCHSQMNPLGFASEHFDSLGRLRPNSQELKFDSNGKVANAVTVNTVVKANLYPGDDTEVANVAELAKHIAASGKGQHCFVRQYFRYSHNRDEDLEKDSCSLESMRTQLTASGGSLLEMIKAAAKQRTFKNRRVK